MPDNSDIRKQPPILGKGQLPGNRKHLVLAPEKQKAAVDQLAPALTPLIMQAIKENGINLSASEMAKLNEFIAKGVDIQIKGDLGKVAQVSGSVAGSVSVDW